MASSRPSTSGGLAANGPTPSWGNGINNYAYRNLDKRMSKDDMFFTSTPRRAMMNYQTPGEKRMSKDDMYIRSRMAGMSQFHMPVRGSVMTPEYSPDYADTHEVSIPIRMQTPESMTSGEIPIGMAIGSPTFPVSVSAPAPAPAFAPPTTADPSRWQARVPSSSSRSQMVVSPEPSLVSPEPSLVSPVANGPGPSLQRKKTRRGKLFGLFGGGKKNADAQPQLSPSRERAGTPSRAAEASARAPARSNTQSDKRTTRHKPELLRSATMPQNTKEDGFARPTEPLTASQRPRMPATPSFLDVKIPDTKMERYSVMFSDVLNQGPRHENATSLLARRQATLERLKMINDSIEAEAMEKQRAARGATTTQRPRIRRVTSPQPAPSPRLSIFPAPSSTRAMPAADMPTTLARIARSNTSPGRLPSPTNPTFARPPPSSSARRRSPQRNLTVPNPFAMHPTTPGSAPRPRQNQPIYPTDTSFHFGPSEPQAAGPLDSPASLDSQYEIVVAQPFKPTLHEPQWQMISPSSLGGSSPIGTAPSLSGGRRPSAASSSSSSAATHITKPSIDSSADAALQNAVEVSIARQISVSRQQRNLLRPLRTGTAPVRDGAGGGRSPLGVTVVKQPSPTVRLGRDEPIKDVSSSTPTLVHQEEGGPFAKLENRKSSWVVLESD